MEIYSDGLEIKIIITMKPKQSLYKIMQIRSIQEGLIIFVLILTFSFPIRLLSVVLTVGENNLSNDYLEFTDPIIRIANNAFQFDNLKDTCFKSQCEPLTFMLMGWGAKYFDWDVRIEIVFSVLVAFVTVFLVYFSIAGITFQIERIWLLAFISAFSFSYTLMSTYTFGQAAIYTTTAFFGLSLGIFAVKIYPNSMIGVIALAIGMWISVSSYGGGLFAIPILFLGLLIGFRKIRYYILWFISLLITSIPYLQVFSQTDHSNTKINIIGFFRFEWISKLLGFFFSNELWFPYPGTQPLFTSIPLVYGAIGFCVLCLGLFFILHYYGINHVMFFYSELALIPFSLGPIWIASLFREGIAPWYVSNALPFWLGLLGLYYSLIFKEKLAIRLVSKKVKGGYLILLLAVIILFFHSNITYQDKIFHLITRAPASASCLRHSSIAPTYCEPFLFQWGLGNPQLIDQLGRPLEENGLSVYSPKQEWILQGDYLFDSVQILSSPQGINPYWIDAKNKVTNWGDYHRLNLVLPSGSKINWTVQIPDKPEMINFETILDILFDKTPEYNKDSLYTLRIEIIDENNQTYIYKYELSGMDLATDKDYLPVTIPLQQFSGQEIRLSLSALRIHADYGDVNLRTPVINLIAKNDDVDGALSYQPENVRAPEISASFFRLWPLEHGELLLNKMSVEKYNFYKKGENASATFKPEGDLCVYNSTYFYITISVDEILSQRYGTFLLNIKNLNNQSNWAGFVMPFLSDGGQHTYTYPIKLHLSTSPSYLENIEIRPLEYPGVASFRIKEMGFFDQENDLTRCLENFK